MSSGNPARLRGRVERRVGLVGRRFARDDGHAGRAISRRAAILDPIARDGLGRRPDEDDPGSRAGRGEVRILGEEPVARVDGVGAGRAGGVEDPPDVDR